MTDIGHNKPPVDPEKDYRGYKITLTKNFWFGVTGPDWPERRGPFQTYDQATNEIDAQIKRQNKQETIAKTLKLTFRDRIGRAVTFRGFNSNDSSALVTPKPQEDDSRWYRDENDLYPDVPWLVELLAERAAHKARIAEIDKTTKLYGMSARASQYGGRINAEHYQNILDAWLKEMNKKRDEALAK